MPDIQINPSNPLGVLILIPFFIAASAAFLALKTTKAGKQIFQYLRAHTRALRSTNRRRKDHRSNTQSDQVYGDSFSNLESANNLNEIFTEQSLATQQDNGKETLKKIWHPNRSSRLTWSFENSQSPDQSHFESLSVQKPVPVAHAPEKTQLQDGNSQDQLKVHRRHQEDRISR
jgi:hypothetical protein